MVSKKGVAMVVAAALLLSIGGLCVKMIPWQPLSINSFRSFISGGNSAGVCPVNPAQTPVDRGSGFRGAGRVRSRRPCIPLPPN